jgi:hypothetical protein
MECFGRDRIGNARQAWTGKARIRATRTGAVRQARLGEDRIGGGDWARMGMAVKEWRGLNWKGDVGR